MLLVDAVVDDPDLDPGAGVPERRAGQVPRADGGRVGAGERLVGDVGEDLLHAGEAREPWKLAARNDDRQPVGDQPIPPADGRRRDRLAECRREAPLLRLEVPCCADDAAGARERRRGELDDHLGARPRLRSGLWCAGSRARERRQQRCGHECGEGGERAGHVD